MTTSLVDSNHFATPRVVFSACIELEECRHDGQRIANRFVGRLFPFVQAVPVCPEVAIGLGIPRPTIRLVDDDGATRLMQPATRRDLQRADARLCRRLPGRAGPG